MAAPALPCHTGHGMHRAISFWSNLTFNSYMLLWFLLWSGLGPSSHSNCPCFSHQPTVLVSELSHLHMCAHSGPLLKCLPTFNAKITFFIFHIVYLNLLHAVHCLNFSLFWILITICSPSYAYTYKAVLHFSYLANCLPPTLLLCILKPLIVPSIMAQKWKIPNGCVLNKWIINKWVNDVAGK